ncbi:restriction endonuclease subunit S [Salmonella enterica]|nr:restriction endonuclease subunit S [Salmonella enterica subsp. enterica]ELC6656658.1 restriction endonuclease subunit S [Salmonella enterica]
MSFDLLDNLSIKLIDGDRGKNYPKQSDFLVQGECLFLSAKNVTKNGFEFSDCTFISTEKDQQLRAGKLDRNDIILTTRGTIGNVALYDSKIDLNHIRINSGMIILRPNTNIWNPKFLYFLLNSELVKKQISALTSGSAVPQLPARDLKKFVLPVIPLKRQNRIVEIIGGIADKIHVNNIINSTLEQMAQALFKSWFIDFEPVKAKIAVLEAGGSQEEATLAAMTAISGKDADSLADFAQNNPEKYAGLKATAELFPSAMQDIDLVKIPRGWRLVPLNNIASFASGKINVSELTKDTYISTENMLVNKMGIECATSLPSARTTPSFNPEHILISNIRPYFKKIWLARFSGGRSADVLAFEHKKHITAEYLYNILYQDSFFDFMMQTSKGVKMPRGDKKAIMEWSCIEPDTRLVKIFSNKVKEFYSYIESHNRENTLLSQLRDTLLPKLLSGEITLPEAEEIAKEADYV